MHISRRFSRSIVLGLSSSLLIFACQAPSPTQQALQPQQQAQTQDADGIVINNDKEALARRVEKKNETVSIDKSGFTTQQLNPLDLTLVAEVAPPEVSGTRVQATNVFIENNLAYVSYDVAGDEFSGGAYIIDISNPRDPKLLSEVTSADTDFYSLTKSGNELYLSGASPQRRLASPSLLQVMNLSADGRQFTGVRGHVDLPSFAATDVSVSGNDVYVTTGDKGGGIAKVNRSSLKRTGYYPLEDARSVSLDYAPGGVNKVTAFKGSGGEVHVLDSELQLEKKVELPGTATIPVSKSTVEIQDNLAVIGAGDGGTVSVDLDTGNTVSRLKAGGEGITNGASIDGNFVFMAEGFDGVGVAEIQDGTPKRLGSVNFKNDASANMVALKGNVLFVANGKGGLRILTVNDTPPVVEPGYHSVMFRSNDGSNKNPLVVTRATVKLSEGAELVGVITDKDNKKIPNLLASDRLFSGSITPNMPELLNQATSRHFETTGTGASGDWYKFVDDKTFEAQFNVTGGADDMRLLIDYGDTPAPNQYMIVTLHPDQTTEPGIIVGDNDEEVMERKVPLTDAQGNIIVDGNYTLATEVEDMDLIVMREGTAAREIVPEAIIERPEPPKASKADIVFILDGGNSPSQETRAVRDKVFGFIDGLNAAQADVTFAVATTATKFKKHPHNDDVDATKLVLDATTQVSTVKEALTNHPHIGGTSMDTYSSLVETLADPTQGDLEADQVTRRKNPDGSFVPLIQIVITDHQPEQLRGKFVNYPKSDDPQREADVAAYLKANNACVHVMLEKGFFDRYDQITEATNGSLMDIGNLDGLETELQKIIDKVMGLPTTPTPTPPTPAPSPEAPPEPEPTVPEVPNDPCYGTPENWVVNGGFEEPVVGNSWKFVNDLGCWKIGAPGKAELDPASTWAPAEGAQSLDLNPDKMGEIYQDIYTQPGQDYTLSFAMGGNITHAGVKSMEVFWGEQSLGQFSFDTTGKSKNNMGWEDVEITIPGSLTHTKQTRLRFKSTTASSTGVVIDKVVVK